MRIDKIRNMTIEQKMIGAGLSAITGGLIATSIAYFAVVKPQCDATEVANREFRQVYHQALFEYADTNPHDDFVSTAEQDEFDRKLLEDKAVTLVRGNMPRYKDGSEVPTEVVTEWIRNYKPK